MTVITYKHAAFSFVYAFIPLKQTLWTGSTCKAAVTQCEESMQIEKLEMSEHARPCGVYSSV